MNITKDEAYRISEMIESSVLSTIKTKEDLEIDWLVESLDAFRKLATYSGYRVFAAPAADQDTVRDLEERLAAAIAEINRLDAKLKESQIDAGKCLALREAGWELDKIAEEMQLTKTQVSNAIAREKRKRREAIA